MWDLERAALTRRELRLKRLRELELENQDRLGYLAHPQREEEFRGCENAAEWPERGSQLPAE
jgi:hypothetical protein